MSEQRGTLIVSTKSQAAGRKIFAYIFCGLFYVLAIASFFYRKSFISTGFRLFHSVTAGEIFSWAIVLILFAYPTYLLLFSAKRVKSYCDVYENVVVGATVVNKNNTNIQRFELPYHQIASVGEQKYSIIIHTDHGSYEVLALKNRTEAIQAIRSRLSAKK